MKRNNLKILFYITFLAVSYFCLLSCSDLGTNIVTEDKVGVGIGYVEVWTKDSNGTIITGVTINHSKGEGSSTYTPGHYHIRIEIPGGFPATGVTISANKSGYKKYVTNLMIEPGEKRNLIIIMELLD